MINDNDFNEKLQDHYRKVNMVGLAELLMFGSGLATFLERENQRQRVTKAVVAVAGWNTSARQFARKISYEDFKKTRGISEATALGLRLYLLYHCGVDWLRPDAEVKGMG